jgi:uridine kinase
VRSPEPHIILIDGRSGVGKTHCAVRIADALDATLVHLDDACHGWGGLAAGRDAMIDTVLTPLALGLPGRFRAWDWERDIAGDIVDVPPAAVVVIEGCGVSTPRSRALASTVVWVECDETVRMRRLFGRDRGEFNDFYEAWDAQVNDHIAHNNPITTATVVVRS